MDTNHNQNMEDFNMESFKNFSKKNSFLVPELYFENFENELLSNIHNQKNTSNISIIPFFKPLFIAAIFAMCFFSFFWFQLTQNTAPGLSEKEVRSQLSKIEDAEIEIYLINHMDEINEEELIKQSNSLKLPIYKSSNDLTEEEKKQLLDDWIELDNTEINI
ncbi:MAG: hypothetical protein WCP57_06585 [Bacteroidota bacterium]